MWRDRKDRRVTVHTPSSVGGVRVKEGSWAIQDLSPLEEVDSAIEGVVVGRPVRGRRKQADQQGRHEQGRRQTPEHVVTRCPCTTCQQ